MPEKNAPTTEEPQEEGLGIRRYRQIKNKDLVKRRRSQILDAARKLFIKKGFPVTTIQDICEESGVNPGSLYDYVQNKDDILRQLFKEMMGEDSETRNAYQPSEEINNLEALRRYMHTAIDHSWTNIPDVISLAYQETRFLDQTTKEEIMSSDRDLITRWAGWIKEALGREVDQERLLVIASLLVFSFAFLPLKGWTTRGLESEKIIETTVEFFIKGLDSL
ncbi:MAG: TetR/AcrR family transcriptional regulator [Deltaproteobacteria bacterium]|nr:TetR/AcrR family transcriptional regulator [Deltaproteobacteria bacterium]